MPTLSSIRTPGWYRSSLLGYWSLGGGVQEGLYGPPPPIMTVTGVPTIQQGHWPESRALRFGNGVYGQIPYPFGPNTGGTAGAQGTTVAYWARGQNAAVAGALIDCRQPDSNGFAVFYDSASGKASAFMNPTGLTMVAPLADAYNGQWHFSVFTLLGGVGNLYFDGKFAATAGSVSYSGYNPVNVQINRAYDATTAYDTTISDMWFYQRALPANEIAEMYAWQPRRLRTYFPATPTAAVPRSRASTFAG